MYTSFVHDTKVCLLTDIALRSTTDKQHCMHPIYTCGKTIRSSAYQVQPSRDVNGFSEANGDIPNRILNMLM
jgi:hypothetical protein